MLGVMRLPAVRDTAADGLLDDGFEVGYVAEDGTQRRLLLTDVWAVRFEAMAPVRPRFESENAFGEVADLPRQQRTLVQIRHA